MKNLLLYLSLGLTCAACTKEASLRKDSMLLDSATDATNSHKKSTQVTFHLVSVQTEGIAGWWTMNVQEGWDGTGPMLQQWFQMRSTDPMPFNDSTFLYLKHDTLGRVAGQEEPVSIEDGQFNIHLMKQSEHSRMVDGVMVITQKGKWELVSTFGIYSRYAKSRGGHYTYTFSPQPPLYYYKDGIAYSYGETKREVYLKGVLQQ